MPAELLMAQRICPHCRNLTDARLCPDDGFQTVDASLYTPDNEDPLLGSTFEERRHNTGLYQTRRLSPKCVHFDDTPK